MYCNIELKHYCTSTTLYHINKSFFAAIRAKVRQIYPHNLNSKIGLSHHGTYIMLYIIDLYSIKKISSFQPIYSKKNYLCRRK